MHSSYGLQELGDAQQLLFHRQGLSVHPSHQAFVLLLEEHDGHIAPQGLAFVAPVLLPCQGLVLGDVQDHRGLAGELVHEALA